MTSLAARVRRLEVAQAATTIAGRLSAAEKRLSELTPEQSDAKWRALCLGAVAAPDLPGDDKSARLQRAHRRIAAAYLGA
jgi:hypothetical protein